MPYNYTNSVKYHVDKALESGELDKNNIRTTEINFGNGNPNDPNMRDDEIRNNQILDAIKILMGTQKSK